MNHSNPLGQTAPNTEGPRITPAANWPITDGRPTRRMA